eukprot:m.138453 g.138453  ORF g.138453 m.138453 type:complete len:221 (+) comp14882_c0_seq1:60-722(+)
MVVVGLVVVVVALLGVLLGVMDVDGSGLDDVIQNHGKELIPLFVGKELNREVVEGSQGVKRYVLQGLQPLSNYEVRISYVGVHPLQVKLSFDCGGMEQYSEGTKTTFEGGLKHIGGGVHRQRDLLDAEKIMFQTDADGLPLLSLSRCQSNTLVVDVIYASFPVPRKGPPTHLFFNIILEEAFAGVVTWEVLRISLFLFSVVVVVQLFVAPYLLCFLRQLL